MIVSFDLDGVLLLSRYADPAQLEPALPFPWSRYYGKDRLRKGSVELIHALQSRGFDVWIYTSSGRSKRYLRRLFRHYGIRFGDIINMDRHEKEVQLDRVNRLPSKMPSRYHISLHVDDEEIVARSGREYGFNVFLMKNDNANWVSDIIACAEKIRDRERRQNGIQQYGTEKVH